MRLGHPYRPQALRAYRQALVTYDRDDTNINYETASSQLPYWFGGCPVCIGVSTCAPVRDRFLLWALGDPGCLHSKTSDAEKWLLELSRLPLFQLEGSVVMVNANFS